MAKRPVSVLLLGVVMLALLIVGVVSGTILRHIAQTLPIAIIFAAMWAGVPRSWLPTAALAMHLFWLFVMVAIWLFLTGMARIVTGHFTPAEIVLTLVIGAAAMAGSIQSIREALAASTWRVWIASFVIGAVLQYAAFWVSTHTRIARM